METPYVVMFQNVNILSGDGGGVTGRCGPKIQECWEFEHPRKDVTVDEKGQAQIARASDTRCSRQDRVTSHEQPQRSLGKAIFPYSSCGGDAWTGRLFRGDIVRRCRVEHPSVPQRADIQRHVELVSALLPLSRMSLSVSG